MKKYILAISAVLLNLLLWSCDTHQNIKLSEAPAESICSINTNGELSQIGHLSSMSIVNDGHFVISSDKQVVLFDISGHQTANIGRRGKAAFEYLMPLIVRSQGDIIYVWDAMQQKFISYSLDGEALDEFTYDSAVSDFYVNGNCLAVYNMGNNDKYAMDILSLDGKKISNVLPVDGESHQLLNHWFSSAPVCSEDGKWIFMLKDRLDLYQCEEDGSNCKKTTAFDSDSFIHTKLSSRIQDTKAEDDFLNKNSYIVSLFKNDSSFLCVTKEGYSVREDKRKLNNENRFFSVYRIIGSKGRKLMSFPCEGISSALFSAHQSDLFFIQHSIENEEDVYKLKKLLVD